MSDNNTGPEPPLQGPDDSLHRITTLLESRRGSLFTGLLMAVTILGGLFFVLKDLL